MARGDPTAVHAVACTRCGQEARLEEEDGFVPSICGGIMGDEYVETWYRCPTCDVFTVEVLHDRFLGEEEVALRGPVAPAEAAERIALIRRCERRWDKRCRCAAHRAYFGAWLD